MEAREALDISLRIKSK